LYPQAADYDLYDEVAQYYQLFYHCDLTREQYDALMAKAIDK
ncbi:MAG: ABC transporter substrate-binding protein, partial [Candidatus Ventricola sp.]|nr:ABC transporter substrate-binding protein [Candidatus Ventricola sp.]